MIVSSKLSKLTWITITSFCSTSMVVTNKLILNRVHLPMSLTSCQLFAAFALTGPKVASDGFTRMTYRDGLFYILEASLFALSLLANLQALMLTGVGTVIVGRSTVPLLTFAFEAVTSSKVNSRAMYRSLSSLVGVILFSSLYALTDGRVQISGKGGIIWLVLWICLVACQMVYGKWLISSISLSRWERVFYTNSCALPFMFLLCIDEWKHIDDSQNITEKYTLMLVMLSCTVGIAISYSSWRLRELISATSFGLVGVVNKMVTVCVSALIWPKSFSVHGMFAITGCVLSALFYSELRTKS